MIELNPNTIRIPSLAECHWDMPPVPEPRYVCWHPASDDCFNISGCGQRLMAEAYCAMLDSLYEHYCDEMTDEQDAIWAARIMAAHVQGVRDAGDK